MVKAADMLIARRADTRARADVATWKMMAKLNGSSGLPPHAQGFLARYDALVKETGEPEATEALTRIVYESYYAEMGGVGPAPAVPAPAVAPRTDNVMAFKPPPAKPRESGRSKPSLPVALIFAGLAVVYVGIRYFLE